MAIEAEDTLSRYCARVVRPTFWGGEAELLVLAKILGRPIVVYLPAGRVRAGKGRERRVV